MALGDVIARLSVSLDLNTSAFERGSKRAAQQTETLGKKMTRIAGVIGTAFVASIGVDTVRAWADATKGALDFAGSLGETAQQLGVTTDELQEYRYVASQVGIEQAAMDKGMAKLSVTLGNMAADVGGTAETLEKFGFTQEEVARISQLTAGEALPFLAEKYAALTSPTEKAALAAVFFGSKMGGTFIPALNEGAAGLEKMRAAAHELGIVISEEAIKNADANADLLTTYEKLAKAQETATLTLPENVKAYMAYQKAITDLKVGLYQLIAGFSEWAEENKKWETHVVPAWQKFEAWAVRFQKTLSDVVLFVPRAISQMVTSITSWIGDKLAAVWEKAMLQIRSVGALFEWLYDVVVKNSYVPDMVDGIAAEMARLDAVMVKPVTAATTKAEEAFRDMAGNVQGLLDRLFPEVRRLLDFRADLATIEGSGLGADQQTEARRRLGIEFGGGGKTAPDFGEAGGSLTQGIDDVSTAIERLTEKSKVGTVRIAKSFADMATSTLQSLGQLANAIKGGGFLDILTQVANVALQLGQAGAFGGKVSTFLNQPPKYANGTNFHPGGLALVGERGPELVSMPRGSRVTPNSKMGGGLTVNVNAQDAVLAETVRGWVAEGVGIAINGGAAKGVATMAKMRDRALA